MHALYTQHQGTRSALCMLQTAPLQSGQRRTAPHQQYEKPHEANEMNKVHRNTEKDFPRGGC